MCKYATYINKKEALLFGDIIISYYRKLGYEVIKVATMNIKSRVNFILNKSNLHEKNPLIK